MKRQLLMAVVLLLLGCLAVDGAERLRDVIDGRVSAVWKDKGITPADPASDAEFLRRIYLDLHGQIPTVEQATSFLDDSDPAKREKLIERLLSEPRYAVHQADVWDMVYFGRNPPGYNTDKREGFQLWLEKQFASNTPYNTWAGDILRAEGNSVEQGPPMFLVQYRNQPEDAAEAVSRRFLGVQVQCARCHDHPFEDWTQVDFYGFAAFFARLEVVDIGKKKLGDKQETAFVIGEKNKGDVLFTGPVSEDEPGKKGTPVKPKFLAGDPLDEPESPEDLEEPRNFPNGKVPPEPKFSRKDALVDWMTAKENPYFARAAVNRIWAQFMGKGIVSPVDNLSEFNPPSHPELLADLEREFVAHDFDIKWLITEILNSQTYQLSGASVAESTSNEAMPLYYERAPFRPLSAEELFESWMLATGYRTVLEKQNQAPKGRLEARGITWDYLRRFFGEPNDGVGNFQGGMSEHLYLNNGQVRQMIADGEGGLFAELNQPDTPVQERVERLFLQTLSRRPDPAELEKFSAFLTVEDDRDLRDRCHDAIWTLVTCSEFRFNH